MFRYRGSSLILLGNIGVRAKICDVCFKALSFASRKNHLFLQLDYGFPKAAFEGDRIHECQGKILELDSRKSDLDLVKEIFPEGWMLFCLFRKFWVLASCCDDSPNGMALQKVTSLVDGIERENVGHCVRKA